jgi:two-component system, response regulator
MERKKMLIVEDSPADVMLVKLAVEETGVPIDVIHLADGDEMLKYLEGNSIKNTSFVLLDLNIPKANGIDILKHKSTLEDWSSVPVILYSSSARQEDIRQAMHFGASAYVCKPVDFEQFNRTIQHLVVFWGEMNMAMN